METKTAVIIPANLNIQIIEDKGTKILTGSGELSDLVQLVTRLSWGIGDRIKNLTIKDQLEFWGSIDYRVDYEEESPIV